MKTPDHLGGHQNKTWVDSGALMWAKETLGVESMIDIGCGPGGMQQPALDFGITWTGIDGDPNLPIQGSRLAWDFCDGIPFHLYDEQLDLPHIDEDKQSLTVWDLAWSVEFLEHVEERYQDNYMPLFGDCKYVIVTAAPPGWTGHHHVNEQTQDYWIAAFANYGMRFDPILTQDMRDHSTMRAKGGKESFMKMTGMVYVND